ncbi:MAG TPA: PAS domain S-box protein [Verrucomicrobiae bacterium]|jgi:PAS domain S-box-containing protein|nr:PAS domain S-box protein [Verrucomicrobiae bacterium]
MKSREPSIRRKIMTVTMLTSTVVLTVTVLAFMAYDVSTFRESMRRNLTTLAQVTAENSTAALAFGNDRDAADTLSSLRLEPQIVAAALYDSSGKLFVRYPTNLPPSAFPIVPPEGYKFKGGHLFLSQRVARDSNLLGHLYLESDLRYFYERVKIYSAIAALIMFGSLVVALVLANRLQKRISAPIIALAATARTVSERRDYSVRAPKLGPDELGVLTDAFNEMLTRIEQHAITSAFLSAIVQSSDDSIIGKDLTGKVVSWNAGAERTFGYTAAEIVGSSIERLVAPDRPDEERRILENAKRGETRLYETIRIRKDGSPVDISLSVSPIRDAQGNIVGVSSIARDITERKRAEEQILRLNADLEHRVQLRTAELTAANQELEAFTYSVAHDLRAPLRHIDAFTRILQEDFAGSFPPEAAQLLETIRRGSENMSRLVNDLLNLAHVGRQEMKRERTSLKHLITEVIGELKRETEGREIEWRVAELPTVEGDPGLLKQVFANLLSNATKYTRPRQHAVIEIGLRVMNDEQVIYVRDNGVGFNMKYADKLFGVFQRLHRAEEFEGTGVGLAIVERVVKRHGGHIWAEAELDKGATFYFSLDGLNKTAKPAARPPGTGIPSGRS